VPTPQVPAGNDPRVPGHALRRHRRRRQRAARCRSPAGVLRRPAPAGKTTTDTHTHRERERERRSGEKDIQPTSLPTNSVHFKTRRFWRPIFFGWSSSAGRANAQEQNEYLFSWSSFLTRCHNKQASAHVHWVSMSCASLLKNAYHSSLPFYGYARCEDGCKKKARCRFVFLFSRHEQNKTTNTGGRRRVHALLLLRGRLPSVVRVHRAPKSQER